VRSADDAKRNTLVCVLVDCADRWSGCDRMVHCREVSSEPTLSTNEAHAFDPWGMVGGLGRSPQEYVYQNESLPSAPQETSRDHKGVPQDQSGEVRSDEATQTEAGR